MRMRILEFAMPWLVAAGVILVWQVGVDVLQIQPFVLPSPLEVFQAYAEYQPTILEAAFYTLVNTLIGFAIGVACGLALGILIGSSRLPIAGSIRC